MIFEWFLGLLLIIVFFFIFSRTRFQIPGLSPISLFLAILIFVAAVILFNVIWSDITDFVRPEGIKYYGHDEDFFSYKIEELLAHALYVVPLLVIAVILYAVLEKKGIKYRVVTFPYFAAAGIMIIRLLIDVGAFAIERFEKAGMYAVLIILLVILSTLILFVQKKWEERKKNELTPPTL